MITLQGGEGDIPLFRSGGVQLHRRVEPILDRIAEVLQEVPGDVTITGHTDGQGRSAIDLRREALAPINLLFQMKKVNQTEL